MRDERAEGLRWLRQAENDLEFGRLALREGYFAQACFIAQQSAEKALKALAYGSGERLVVGHSLVELVDRLRDQFGGCELMCQSRRRESKGVERIRSVASAAQRSVALEDEWLG